MAEELFTRQMEILKEIEHIYVNFGKDSVSRKTPEYLRKRLEALEGLWSDFDSNNSKLQAYEDKSYEYFSNNIYEVWKGYYEKTRKIISSYKPGGSKPTAKFHVPVFEEAGEIEHLVSQQCTNFRAFERLMNRINLSSMEEKWEIEDELKNLQHLWNTIDGLHLRIDNILQGSDQDYENDYSNIEGQYIEIKKRLNRKLSSSDHLRHITPQIDIPVFIGKYTQWPTFYDLFMETIHNSKFLTKTQKMQHLKSKVKGEAERLIQHLNITAENYDTAWSLLTGRYNNPQVLFTNQIEIFLNQAVIQKQSSYELRKLYDTTMECIHSIHNLGIDTSTWDPLLVHLVSKKLDSETYTDYKEARSSPRDLASFEELMAFIEKKFMALEPIQRKGKEPSTSIKHEPQPPKYTNSTYNNQRRFLPKNYQAVVTSFTRKCPLCDLNHDLYQCQAFLNLPKEIKIETITKLQVCQNCLFKHTNNKCTSIKTCKICNGKHNTLIHDAAIHGTMNSTPQLPPPPPANTTNLPPRQHNVNYVASEDEEILLTTLSLNIKASDGTFFNFRALLDQGSQVSLISERAAQTLGLKRQHYQASVSGIGTSSKQSKGIVSLECQSIYGDYQFTTQALVVSQVINSLPSATLQTTSWEHLQHTRLADPEYHVSRPIDILLDASIYSDIIMSGLVKGTRQAPIAQQTKLGWILSGHVRTFSCNVVIRNLEDIQQSSDILTAEDQYCEDHYQATTKRLENGRYQVALPMKPDFKRNLGQSRAKATAEFIQQERRMAKNESLSEGYKKFIHEYQQLGHMLPTDVQGTETACYLPHHGVLKLDSTTTALRIVFNASSNISSGLSLNNLMESGPNLQQDLQSLILKWRQYKYVITADIEKMFRQILIRKSDQHLQSILWRDSPRDLVREYHLTTVTYSTKAAPYLAMRTLKQIGSDNSERFKLAASALENSFDMDDLLTRSSTIKQAKELQHQLKISTEWLQVTEDSKNIPTFSISRYLGSTEQSFQIHRFCDASEKAYACSIYFVTHNNKGEYTSRLIAAVSKVTLHNKIVTLPRLELLGALLLSQLIKQTVSIENIKVYAWTDSMALLGWLQGDILRWKQLVSNRVSKITETIPSSSWRHVKSGDNAADCATRGGTSMDFLEHKLWWEGPEWLLTFDPNNINFETYPNTTLKVKRTSVNTTLLQNQASFLTTLLNKCISITRIVKIVAWVSRFIARLRNTEATAHGRSLTPNVMQDAYNIIIKKCDFIDEIKQFWKKWPSEYLQQLQTRARWRTPKKNLKIDDVIIIKEENLPPGKWAMGRVEELYPGKDGYVRVVSVKTQNNKLKRPIHKLILSPSNNSAKDELTHSKQPTSSTSTSSSTLTTPKQRRQRKDKFKCLFATALLFMSLFSPSMQQDSAAYNITPLNDTQHLYFDKISDLQHIRDEWKLIVYYNMSSFWQGVEDIQLYVTHLRKICRTTCQYQEKQYEGIILQLEHQLNEIYHYNGILNYQNKRFKRGLANGVGNVASYLFGVLDDKFADQYKRDIEKIAVNENHLQNLIRNQTLVVESEYNILRRHESIVKTQFNYMNQYLRNVSMDVNKSRQESQNGLFIMSSTLSANIILSNLRSIQQSLIETITDVNHGRIDTHLLSPEQLEEQVNIITRQLQGDLIVPSKENVRDLYKLLRVFARVINNYLIMEFKIPLITNEVFELDKIISLPFKDGLSTYRLSTAYPYLAFNLRKDIGLFLSQNDLQSCIHASHERILCPIDKPIYDMRARQSICDLKLMNMELNKASTCTSEQSTCSNKWIKLQHRQNDWLYACCEECTVRILCPADTEIRTLSGNGLVSLGQGCTLRGNAFTIFSHRNFINRVNTAAEKVELPQMSILNTLIKTSGFANSTLPFREDNNTDLWNQLGAQIADLKQQSTQQLTVHDVHQYIVSYSMIVLLFITLLIVGIIWIRKRRLQKTLAVQEMPVPQPRILYRTTTADKGTSPRELHAVKFELPKSN